MLHLETILATPSDVDEANQHPTAGREKPDRGYKLPYGRGKALYPSGKSVDARAATRSFTSAFCERSGRLVSADDSKRERRPISLFYPSRQLLDSPPWGGIRKGMREVAVAGQGWGYAAIAIKRWKYWNRRNMIPRRVAK